MITNLQTIADNKFYKLIADDKSNLALKTIDFTGPGLYSKDDDAIYRKGVRPTFSRIRIDRNKPVKFEFESARRAIEQAKASEGGVAILMDGKNYVMHREYADELIVRGKELAYLCDHNGRIVTIPVND